MTDETLQTQEEMTRLTGHEFIELLLDAEDLRKNTQDDVDFLDLVWDKYHPQGIAAWKDVETVDVQRLNAMAGRKEKDNG